MESKVKIAGHGVHPILIVVPLGLLTTAVIFDVIRAFNDSGDPAVASFFMIAPGIIGGLVAALFGLIDRIAVPPGGPGAPAGRRTASKLPHQGFERPSHCHFGPDGALYVVDWGDIRAGLPRLDALTGPDRDREEPVGVGVRIEPPDRWMPVGGGLDGNPP